jgi:hypothetical protein
MKGGEQNPRLVRLDRKFLNKWYYRLAKNRFWRDIYEPFEPHIMRARPKWKYPLFYIII